MIYHIYIYIYVYIYMIYTKYMIYMIYIYMNCTELKGTPGPNNLSPTGASHGSSFSMAAPHAHHSHTGHPSPTQKESRAATSCSSHICSPAGSSMWTQLIVIIQKTIYQHAKLAAKSHSSKFYTLFNSLWCSSVGGTRSEDCKGILDVDQSQLTHRVPKLLHLFG